MATAQVPTGLAGKTALVTGGASGIGQSIAVGLVESGVTVRIADLRPADETVAMVGGSGTQVSSEVIDLRDENAVRSAVAAAIGALGHIDLFVNVAGIYRAEPVTGISAAVWSDLFATNVTACALLGREVAIHMIARGAGAILIVGSTVVCAPSYAGAAYRASKVALRSLMETFAIELAPFGIRVNMLTPGPFPTRLNDDLPTDQRVAGARDVPLGQREGRLEEVRGTAQFLLSDDLASYVTGTEVFVDGGWHLRPVHIGGLDVVRRLNVTEDRSS